MHADRVIITFSLDVNGGAETVHVDMAVLPQLLGKLWREHGMMVWREIPEGISQGQLEEEGIRSVRRTHQGACDSSVSCSRSHFLFLLPTGGTTLISLNY